VKWELMPDIVPNRDCVDEDELADGVLTEIDEDVATMPMVVSLADVEESDGEIDTEVLISVVELDNCVESEMIDVVSKVEFELLASLDLDEE
jgi:hypothetical protein